MSITITSSRNKDEIRFVQSPHNESTINTNDFQQQQEWNLYSHIEQSEKVVHDEWNDNDRPCITFSSTISRRPGYFLYNAYMLIFLISVLGFVPFSFSYTTPHFRIQTTCLLILSSINFRWIVTQKLPTVSYLTTLDKYAIGALIFLVSLCAWHAIIGSNVISTTSPTPSQIDQYALMAIGALYFLFHLIYIVYFIVKYLRYSKIGLSTDTQSIKSNTDAENYLKLEDVEERAVSVNKVKLKSSDRTTSNDSGSNLINGNTQSLTTFAVNTISKNPSNSTDNGNKINVTPATSSAQSVRKNTLNNKNGLSSSSSGNTRNALTSRSLNNMTNSNDDMTKSNSSSSSSAKPVSIIKPPVNPKLNNPTNNAEHNIAMNKNQDECAGAINTATMNYGI